MARHFFLKFSEFMTIRSACLDLFHADRHRDGWTGQRNDFNKGSGGMRKILRKKKQTLDHKNKFKGCVS